MTFRSIWHICIYLRVAGKQYPLRRHINTYKHTNIHNAYDDVPVSNLRALSCQAALLHQSLFEQSPAVTHTHTHTDTDTDTLLSAGTSFRSISSRDESIPRHMRMASSCSWGIASRHVDVETCDFIGGHTHTWAYVQESDYLPHAECSHPTLAGHLAASQRFAGTVNTRAKISAAVVDGGFLEFWPCDFINKLREQRTFMRHPLGDRCYQSKPAHNVSPYPRVHLRRCCGPWKILRWIRTTAHKHVREREHYYPKLCTHI